MSMAKKQKVVDDEEINERKWEDMKSDILYKIFSTFTLIEVVLNVSKVCRSWRTICRDEIKWDTLDFTKLKDYFQIPALPDAWSEPPFSDIFWAILKTAAYFGNKNLTRVIFNPHICIADSHLLYIAERCRNVKFLVLPPWSRITPNGYRRAFRIWKGLEAVVLPSCTFSLYIIQMLGENCKKVTSLKTTDVVTKEFALSLSCYMPWLKALSIKSSMLKRDTLIWILEKLKKLQEVNISHCTLADMPFSQIESLVDEKILEKSAHLQMLHYCKNKGCMSCLGVKNEPLDVAYVKRRELLIRLDEIHKLSY